jgi:hypothetical protein
VVTVRTAVEGDLADAGLERPLGQHPAHRGGGVLAATKVRPASSSIIWAYMCFELRKTLNRGRVESRLMRFDTRKVRRWRDILIRF